MIDRLKSFGGSDDLGIKAEELKEQALDMAANAKERLVQGHDFVRTYTMREPAKALGIALGMGVFLGWLIKRR